MLTAFGMPFAPSIAMENFSERALDEAEKRLRGLTRDPRSISGIYNYCDRWCERCPMTSRCWYQYQIAIKLSRAVSGAARAKGIDDVEQHQRVRSDADGSGKVALIGIDAPWRMVKAAEAFPG